KFEHVVPAQPVFIDKNLTATILTSFRRKRLDKESGMLYEVRFGAREAAVNREGELTEAQREQVEAVYESRQANWRKTLVILVIMLTALVVVGFVFEAIE